MLYGIVRLSIIIIGQLEAVSARVCANMTFCRAPRSSLLLFALFSRCGAIRDDKVDNLWGDPTKVNRRDAIERMDAALKKNAATYVNSALALGGHDQCQVCSVKGFDVTSFTPRVATLVKSFCSEDFESQAYQIYVTKNDHDAWIPGETAWGQAIWLGKSFHFAELAQPPGNATEMSIHRSLLDRFQYNKLITDQFLYNKLITDGEEEDVSQCAEIRSYMDGRNRKTDFLCWKCNELRDK